MPEDEKTDAAATKSPAAPPKPAAKRPARNRSRKPSAPARSKGSHPDSKFAAPSAPLKPKRKV